MKLYIDYFWGNTNELRICFSTDDIVGLIEYNSKNCNTVQWATNDIRFNEMAIEYLNFVGLEVYW